MMIRSILLAAALVCLNGPLLAGSGPASSTFVSMPERVEMGHVSRHQDPPVVDEVKIDPGKVRFGNLMEFDPAKKPQIGTVRSDVVYKQIPAYKTILADGVERGTARFTKLMKEATAVYKRAVEAVGAEGYALIVEEGGITGYPVVDLTARISESL